MNWERLDNALLAIVTAIAGGIGWLIRRVLTNEKQIELLQAEIKHRDVLRQEDREAVAEVREDVKEILNHLSGRRK